MIRKSISIAALTVTAAFGMIPATASAQYYYGGGYGDYYGSREYRDDRRGYYDNRRAAWIARERWEQRERWEREQARRRHWAHERWEDRGYWGDDD